MSFFKIFLESKLTEFQRTVFITKTKGGGGSFYTGTLGDPSCRGCRTERGRQKES